MMGVAQPDVNNALRGRRLPVQAILDVLGLEKISAYKRTTSRFRSSHERDS